MTDEKIKPQRLRAVFMSVPCWMCKMRYSDYDAEDSLCKACVEKRFQYFVFDETKE